MVSFAQELAETRVALAQPEVPKQLMQKERGAGDALPARTTRWMASPSKEEDLAQRERRCEEQLRQHQLQTAADAARADPTTMPPVDLPVDLKRRTDQVAKSGSVASFSNKKHDSSHCRFAWTDWLQIRKAFLKVWPCAGTDTTPDFHRDLFCHDFKVAGCRPRSRDGRLNSL